VGTVTTGTGVMIMANSNVEVFGNEIQDHKTISLLMISYHSTGNQINDPKYYPFPEAVHVHSNTFGVGGETPQGEGGKLMARFFGTPLPDIVWDGVINRDKWAGGVPPPGEGIYIHDNMKTGGTVTFGNMGGLATLNDPANAEVQRDLSVHAGKLPPIAPIKIEGSE